MDTQERRMRLEDGYGKGSSVQDKERRKKMKETTSGLPFPERQKWIVLYVHFCHLTTAQLHDATQMGDAKRTRTHTHT